MPRQKTSSRLVRKQQQQLRRQTIWSLLIGAVLLLSFVFVVLPNTVRLLSAILDTSLIEEKDDIPPQVPIVSQPETATNQNPFTIKGFAEPDSQVFVVIDGDELEPVVTNQDGVFEFDLPLIEGDNSFILYSKDNAENTSRDTETYQLVLDTQAPTIALDGLADGQEFIGKANQQLAIKGVTEPSARVYINQRLVLARSDGSFSQQIRLNEGDNQLDFKVIDKAGNESEVSFLVNFKL